MPVTLPQPSGEFEWAQASWGAALRCRAIAVPHLFSTRALPLRRSDAAWDQLALELGVAQARMFRPVQVHGTATIVAPPIDAASPSLGKADIILTGAADAAVAIQAADCVPMLFLDRTTGAVAAAHAGWRGTAAGVAQSAVRAMARHFNSQPADLVVAIGPSIGPCCYQVGAEVLAPFGAEGRRWFYHLAGKWMLNLWSANRDQLVAAGVDGANVHVAELCTAMYPDVFDSFRRDGDRSGRMAAAIKPSRAPLQP
jgi:YfiH family protein